MSKEALKPTCYSACKMIMAHVCLWLRCGVSALLVWLMVFIQTGEAIQEITAPRVRVLYADTQMADYAQQVAHAAEKALDVLVPLFNFQPRTITLVIQDDSDSYNAFAVTIPHLKTTLRPLFPHDVTLGYRFENELHLLLLHELTHNLQLTYTLTAPKEELTVSPEGGFLNPGSIAAPPPAWFVEGVSVWVESTFSSGGRNQDAYTRGLLETLAYEDGIPALNQASVTTYAPWPHGNTRYLLGGAFVAHLVDTHGFESILAALQAYNDRGFFGQFLDDFSTAWQRANGSRLNGEWDAWREALTAKAQTRAEKAQEGTLITQSGGRTGVPTLSPDGKMLAWVAQPGEIKLATVSLAADPEAALEEARVLIKRRAPSTLSWWGEDHLLYSRHVPGMTGTFRDLFSLNIHSGHETRLTYGQRLRYPVATPDGCALAVRDVAPAPVTLMRWCKEPGSLMPVWSAPAGMHIVGISVSAQGRVALSVWQQGQVDVVVLEPQTNRLHYLTQDTAQDLAPSWIGEGALLFQSDRGEITDGAQAAVFDLYRVDIADLKLTRLTQSLGGAFSPEPGAGVIWYSSLGGAGFNLARLNDPAAGQTQDLRYQMPAEAAVTPRTSLSPIAAQDHFPVTTYNPLPSLLRPYAVIPIDISTGIGNTADGFQLEDLQFGLGLSMLSQDITGEHNARLTLGYRLRMEGHLYGAYLYGRYNYGSEGLLQQGLPVSFGVQLGLWPHNAYRTALTDSALGARLYMDLSLPQDTRQGGFNWRGSLMAGAVNLSSRNDISFEGSFGFSASNQSGDTWGYPTRGTLLGLQGVWSPTVTDPSYGMWAFARHYEPVWEGVLELQAHGGYRPSFPFPAPIEQNVAGSLSVGYRFPIKTSLYYGDGMYALERLSVTPRVRTWLDGNIHVGGDISVGADLVVNYLTALSLYGRAGYADGLWFGMGLGISY